MPKRQEHTWKEKTPEGEERTVRAIRIGGKWLVSSKVEEEEYWEHHDTVSEADLRSLRDVLWRKYQRRRLPWEHVVEIDRLLGEDEENAGNGPR